MEQNIITSFEELNASYYNKTITFQGIVTELSFEFEDDTYGFIQIGTLQNLKKANHQISVHHEIHLILPENLVGMVVLGDKIQATGTLIVYNALDNKSRDRAILIKEIKIINHNQVCNLSEQDVKDIKNIATQLSIQYKLTNSLFNNIHFNQDIKIVGTLILFCTDSLRLVRNRIHCKLSLLVIGASGTYKTSFLKVLKNILPNNNIIFSPSSDMQFITYNSRYKIGGQYCIKAGLADFAKDGMILIDNLEELKERQLFKLNRDFEVILRKASIIAAVHTKSKVFNHKKSVYYNLKFSRKNSLLEKFDLILITDSDPTGNLNNYRVDRKFNEEKKEEGSILISKDLLKKYIIYTKRRFDPYLTERAVNRIREFKEEMRRLNRKKNQIKKVNLNNLVRVLTMLSKAYARIALKNEINLDDLESIIRIYKNTLMNLDLI